MTLEDVCKLNADRVLDLLKQAGPVGLSVVDLADSTLIMTAGYLTASGEVELMESQDEYYRVRINENFKSDN